MKKEESKASKSDDSVDISFGKYFEKMRANPWMPAAVVLAIILVAVLIYGGYGRSGVTGNVIGSADIGTKAVDFINTQLLQGQGTVTLDSVNEKSGLYEVNVIYNEKTVPVYFTKDGEYFVQGGLLSLSDIADTAATNGQSTEVPKSDKPNVELFVWSFCPGGVYGESVIKPVVDLLGTKIDARVRFIGPVTTDKNAAGQSCFASQGKSADDGVNECCITYNYDGKTYYSCALHNNKNNHMESYEAERQACILSKAGQPKLSAYLEEFNSNCIAKRANANDFNACAKDAMNKAQIPVNAVNGCVDSKEGLKLLIADYEYGQSLGGIGASPSYFVNGVQVSVNSADQLKQVVCNSFANIPSECSKTVSAADTSTSGSSGSDVTCGV